MDADRDASGRIEEIVVAAQKHSASIQDIPLAVQAFTADRIDELGIHRFEDFALLSPSINIASWIPGATSMVMRGVSDGGGGGDTAATATLYLDEQPLTFRGQVPDLHHYDIGSMDARVGWVFNDGRQGVELFATNLFDEQADIFINTAQADQRITTIRPRTLGVRLRTRFD